MHIQLACCKEIFFLTGRINLNSNIRVFKAKVCGFCLFVCFCCDILLEATYNCRMDYLSVSSDIHPQAKLSQLLCQGLSC